MVGQIILGTVVHDTIGMNCISNRESWLELQTPWIWVSVRFVQVDL